MTSTNGKRAPEVNISFKLTSCDFESANLNVNIELNGIRKKAKVDYSAGQEANAGMKAVSLESVNSSPQIPFSKLFKSLSLRASRDQMKSALVLYKSVKEKKISLQEFFRRLRSLVGDSMLANVVRELQSPRV